MKHVKPELKDFVAVAIDGGCIEIRIDDSLELDGASIKILGENRNFLTELKDLERVTKFCTDTGNPMFIELHTPAGVAVHYVEGSGQEFYKKIKEDEE